jgi:glucuronoarabinoxylan endo-1,4-beta-xylanase
MVDIGAFEGVATTGADFPKLLPTRFALDQNYPNPFNPVTIIRYETSRPGFVSLVVYDVLGREAARLVNGERAPGVHEAVFDAAGLPSGIYVYRLQAGSATQARKMILLR